MSYIWLQWIRHQQANNLGQIFIFQDKKLFCRFGSCLALTLKKWFRALKRLNSTQHSLRPEIWRKYDFFDKIMTLWVKGVLYHSYIFLPLKLSKNNKFSMDFFHLFFPYFLTINIFSWFLLEDSGGFSSKCAVGWQHQSLGQDHVGDGTRIAGLNNGKGLKKIFLISFTDFLS